jgi:hypothetical protein
MLRSLYYLLNSLSRIPGLDFLRGIANSIYDASRIQDNVERAKNSAEDLKDRVNEKREERAEAKKGEDKAGME